MYVRAFEQNCLLNEASELSRKLKTGQFTFLAKRAKKVLFHKLRNKSIPAASD
jgi:hypothetical protein